MATVNIDLTIIKMFVDNKTYTIKAEEIKTEDKQSIEKYKASDSHDPYAISFGECEYSIDLSSVAPEHKQFFTALRERQRKGANLLPYVATYEYVNGYLKLLEFYKKVYITDISRTKNEPFDVKMEALERVYRDAKNALI